MGAIFTQSRTPSEFGSKGCEAKGGFRRKSRTAREEQLRVRHHVHNFLKLTIVPPQWPPLLRLWPRKPLRLRAPLSQRRISEQGWCHYIRFISDSFLPHYPTLTYTTFYTYSPSRLAGLKTVTKDMQTWRAEYKGGDAPAGPRRSDQGESGPASAGDREKARQSWSSKRIFVSDS